MSLSQLGRDLAYLLPSLPLALLSFAALLTLITASAGLVIIWVGVPLLVITLQVARGLAMTERGRLRVLGLQVPSPGYRRPRPDGGFLARQLTPLKDRQAWLDAAHGIVIFPLALITWVLTVVWLSITAGGLTHWIWARYLSEGSSGLSELLDLGVPESLLMLILGVVFGATLVPVTRLLASVHSNVSAAMLCPDQVEALRTQVDHLTHSRAAAAEAEVAAARRLERDIHDGPQQRLVRLGMDLAAAERRMADDPAAALRLMGAAREHSAAALDELRQLSRGIAPPILVDRGLSAAVRELALTSPVPVEVISTLPADTELPDPVSTAAYFTVAEALANMAKHARASSATVRIELVSTPGPAEAPVPSGAPDPARGLRVVVADDGVGGASVAKGHGLAGLRDRLGAVDGTLRLDSPEGGPTVVRADIPCAS